MHHVDKKGFTLIELLVVIAIIAILAGLLLPAVNGVKQKGYETKAKTEVKAIETAVNGFYAEYGKFPLENGTTDGSVTFGRAGSYNGSADNGDLIRILRAIDGAGNNGHARNPRRIVFLEADEGSIDASGNMIDPWDRQYIIDFDTDFNNDISFMNASSADLPNPLEARSVAVFSLGKRGQTGDIDDYILSWK